VRDVEKDVDVWPENRAQGVKNQRCQFIFFWNFSLRQKITCRGTAPLWTLNLV